MFSILAPVAAVAIGVVIAAQPIVNAVLARGIGSTLLATTVSLAVSLAIAVAALVLTGRWGLGSGYLSVPWWAYLGGIAGFLVVGGGLVIAPVTGALTFFICLVTGQLIGALLMDHLGAFGLERRPVDATRLLGTALVVGGAVLAQRG